MNKRFDIDILKTLAITFGTIFYHFAMRLMIGFAYNGLLDNKIDYNLKWFQIRNIEVKIYHKLQVKRWKNKLPTYHPNGFSLKHHSAAEIAMAMCQSELVHETIVVFSFLPLLSAIWFGAFPVFLLTSILSAVFDSIFVVIQRYNRPRVIKLIFKATK